MPYVERDTEGSIVGLFAVVQQDRAEELLPEDAGEVIAYQERIGAESARLPLTARQLRLGLVSNGFSLDQVEATIAAIEDPQARAVAQIEWEYASQFERDHPLLQQVGAALGLTEAQIDNMWQQALSL